MAKASATPPVPKTAAAVSVPEGTNGESSAGGLLAKAVAQLNERKTAIEAELSHTEDLRKELETVNRQVESLQTALAVFGTHSPKGSSQAAESRDTKGEESEHTAPPAESKQDFSGSKRELVTSIVDSRGSAGVTPKEIEGIFAQRKIAKGRNLIYNVLSSSVQHGKMRRENGKYFPVTQAASPSAKAARRGSA